MVRYHIIDGCFVTVSLGIEHYLDFNDRVPYMMVSQKSKNDFL